MMQQKAIRPLIDRLEALNARCYNRDFLLSREWSLEELESILLAAEILEAMYRQKISTRFFSSGLAVSLFRDQSTRTRFSFAGAASIAGLTLMDLDETKSQAAHGETVRETANMISFLTEAIGIRDDMFPGEGDRAMREVSDAVSDGYKNGILAQKPAVINLQSDLDHPTQSLADLMHLKQTFGSPKNLRGKKIAVTWAYSPSYGKPLSVPQGIIALMSRFGMNVHLAHPPGYELMEEVTTLAADQAQTSGGSFTVGNDMEAAFRDADIVYPKSWAPLAALHERTSLLRANQTDRLGKLEEEMLARNAEHKSWECTRRMMDVTKDKNALYMHCLPADISGVSCESGEVSKDVFESQRLQTYREASYKPFIIASMMLHTRCKDPGWVLSDLFQEMKPRKLQ